MAPGDSQFFMARALELARRAWGDTYPNPMVGAVIVEDGQIVAEGWHARAGEPHAERRALAALGRRPKPQAVLYVTLEPCSTHGRTGACCDAILAAGLTKVVVGATDPNPAHGGRGFALLRASGVQVETGVREAECTDLNLLFNHHVTTRDCLWALKVATTLDGAVATRTGASQWITGESARADVHRWRRAFPAIATGVGTILTDNPQLTARCPGLPTWCGRRIILDTHLRMAVANPRPQVLCDTFASQTVVVCAEEAEADRAATLEALGVSCWRVPAAHGRVSLSALRRRCVEAGLLGVYWEAGATLARALWQESAVDYLFHYQAPLLLADESASRAFHGRVTPQLADGLRLMPARVEHFEGDILRRGVVEYPPSR